MNFGHWIVVAFVFFAFFIGALVVVCVREDISLVSDDYYNDELVYQDQIERINNTKTLINKPEISKVGNNLTVRFDQQFNIEKGEMKMFCPSNSKLDKDFVLSAAGNIQQFDISTFEKGMYKAKLLWTMHGEEYYYEEIIYI